MLVLALVVISLVFHALTISRGATNPFLSARSISTVFTQASVIGVLACGMTFIIILTHIDLSVGSALAFLGGLAAWMMGRRAADLPEALAGSVPTGLGWPAGTTIVAVVGIGMILWGLMGMLQNRTAMPAFVITLGGMMGYRGLALLVVKRERPLPTGNLVDQIGTGFLPLALGWVVLGGVVLAGVYQAAYAARHREAAWFLAWLPAGLLASVIIFLQLPHEGVLDSSRGIAYLTMLWTVSTIVMAFVANYSVFGRNVYATGGNYEAARLSGVPVHRISTLR